MVIMEPVQNAGGSFMPPAGYWAGVRELCDRYGILLCADEVITSFGRLGHWFASERFDIRPDMITTAKGLSSAYAAIGALLVSDRVIEPFEQPGSMFTHGMTFGGHPVQAAVALKNIEIMRRDSIVANVAEQQDEFPRRPQPAARAPDRRRPARRATSTRSSSSRTRTAVRAFRTTSAMSSCAASSPRAVQARSDLPRRRPRRPGADLTAARGQAGRVRGDRPDSRRGPRRGVRPHGGGAMSRSRSSVAGRPATSDTGSGTFDAIVVGGGHNGLTAAAYLAGRPAGVRARAP